MFDEPGKYNDLCVDALEKTNAECAVLMIFHGQRGNGFSVNARSMDIVYTLPEKLRDMADQIENDLKSKKSN